LSKPRDQPMLLVRGKRYGSVWGSRSSRQRQAEVEVPGLITTMAAMLPAKVKIISGMLAKTPTMSPPTRLQSLVVVTRASPVSALPSALRINWF